MVAVEMDNNCIDAVCMKNRTTKELVDAYHKIFNRWKASGVVSPNWHMLDNKAPANFIQAIHENKCTVKLVPPDVHHRNATELAIQTFKGQIHLNFS